jgi:YVTN family beta-propeller protein
MRSISRAFSVASIMVVGGLASTHDRAACAQQFLNFESPHIHPLELTPDGSRVAAVNTADGRVEIFDVLGSAPYLRHAGSIAVGLEPVTVRARTATELWVVNHVSDSITIVNAATRRVIRTILTGDEPCDVVFAGTPQRAFVTISQRNQIAVYDPANPSASPTVLEIEGEDPRALATDGERVYAAIFECGNDTSVIDFHSVRALQGIPSPQPAIPANRADGSFFPPLNPSNPLKTDSSLIVKRDQAGRWRDETGFDWSNAVTWDLHGHDLAVIDPQTLGVTYVGGLMTMPMAMTASPSGGVVVVGIESHNHIRFEPNLNGVFAAVEAAHVDPSGAIVARTDLNPHLDYQARTLPVIERLQSIGDPRGVAISSNGSGVFVTGMGSSNLLSLSLDGFERKALAPSAQGPTGIAVDSARTRVLTLNRFDGSISVLDEKSLGLLAKVRFFDPLPQFVKDGRAVLFDTHATSGLGHVSCATCHVDARMDQLAWDLGDPSGSMEPFFGSCNDSHTQDICEDFHPMKGPMTTQTLIGIIGNEPLHWRGDRQNLGAFAHAAQTILSRPTDFTPAESSRLENYLASIKPMPNPNRTVTNGLPASLGLGNPAAALQDFLTGLAVANGTINCVACHRRPDGSADFIMSKLLIGEANDLKVAPIRSVYEKSGFDRSSPNNNRGFGMIHDGSIGTVTDFLDTGLFVFAQTGASGETRLRNMEALVLCWDTGTHAGVGTMVSIGPGAPAPSFTRRNQLIAAAEGSGVDLIVRASMHNGETSFHYLSAAGGAASPGFESDRDNGFTWSSEQLDQVAAAGSTLSYILVPAGYGESMLDRDGDGFRDGDERDLCTNPADPRSNPLGTWRYDIAGEDGRIDGQDLAILLNAWGSADPVANVDCQGLVDGGDLSIILNAWGECF